MFGINKAREEKCRIEAEITIALKELDKINAECEARKKDYIVLKEEYNNLYSGINAIERITNSGYDYKPRANLSELEDERIKAQDEMIKKAEVGLWRIDEQYTLNGSIKNGNVLQSSIGDGYMYAIEAYIAKKEKSATIDNVDTYATHIAKKFNSYQNKANKVGISLNAAYINARLDMMRINAEIKTAKKEETKRLRIERQRLKEQEQLLAEAEKERKRLEAEKDAMNTAFNRALTEEEREQIKSQIADIDKRIANVDYRCTHQKAGWVYVISSPSLPNMCKLGATRRLNPTLRVKELSSSSLPFPFIAHGFVFSDDCFALETALHEYFAAYRVHPDREFFYISPKEAIEVLKNKFNYEVHFESEEE